MAASSSSQSFLRLSCEMCAKLEDVSSDRIPPRPATTSADARVCWICHDCKITLAFIAEDCNCSLEQAYANVKTTDAMVASVEARPVTMEAQMAILEAMLAPRHGGSPLAELYKAETGATDDNKEETGATDV